jgi:SAM-dependent methyltransferase
VNWKWKARIQNVVAAMPMSDRVYYAMQRTVGSLKRGRSNPLEWFDAGLSMAKWVKSAGSEVAGKRILEVGTGRNVCVPTALWLCGAEQVVTVDLNTYLSEALVLESLEYVRRNQERVSQMFGPEAGASGFKERFRQLLGFSGSLSDYLRLTKTKYLAPADATRLDFSDQSFDLHVSHAVFEHIPPDAIRGILSEARRLLAPQGLVLHIIDPSDHFSHDDASITAVNFLQFSEREWEKWAGNKFMYHNRLRGYEYVDLFEQAGARILRRKFAVDEPSLAMLQNGFRLDGRFSQVDPQELAVRGLILMGTFSDDAD